MGDGEGLSLGGLLDELEEVTAELGDGDFHVGSLAQDVHEIAYLMYNSNNNCIIIALRECKDFVAEILNPFKNVLQFWRSGGIVFLNVFKSVLEEGIMWIAGCYLSYLAISIGVTIWVARTLHASGRIFLVDAFHGNAELADSVNRLLVVGFYLINVGYIALALKTSEPLTDFRQVIELESTKLGVVLLILGGMHFFNMFVLARMRRRSVGSVAPGYAAQ